MQTLNVCSIFKSIDGECNSAGQGALTIFIRLAGCNLRCQYPCFGVLPGRRKPRIITSRVPNKKIYDVREGDFLLTFDQNNILVETEVVEVMSREVDRWFRFRINGVFYYVTEDHPFFTTRGLIKANQLIVGDMILHSSATDKISFNKIILNPMRNAQSVKNRLSKIDYADVGEKISATIMKRQREGTYIHSYANLTDEQRMLTVQKLSECKKGSNNPNWGKENWKNYYRHLRRMVKKGEIIKCDNCGNENIPLDVHHLDSNHKNNDPVNLVILCESCHYSDHKIGYNFWNGGRRDGKVLMAMNGFEVQEIKLFDRNKIFPSIRPAPLRVYNFKCKPYDSYLVDYMWVHNCDTPYSFKVDPAMKMSIPDILKKVKSMHIKKVTITGGEPLLQIDDLLELIIVLKNDGYQISVETNGSISWWKLDAAHVDCIIVDYKLPSSGMEDKMVSGQEFAALGVSDFIKFVIMDEKDFARAIAVYDSFKSQGCIASFAFSPVYGVLSPVLLLKWMMDKGLEDGILNLQLHKIIQLKEDF